MQVKHQHSQQNEGGDGRHGEHRLDADSVPGEQRSLHQEKDHVEGNQRRTVVEHGNLPKEGYAQGEPQKGQVGKGDQAGHAYAELPLRVKHPAHRHAQNQGAADDGEHHRHGNGKASEAVSPHLHTGGGQNGKGQHQIRAQPGQILALLRVYKPQLSRPQTHSHIPKNNEYLLKYQVHGYHFLLSFSSSERPALTGRVFCVTCPPGRE